MEIFVYDSHSSYIREYRTLTHKLQRSDQRVHQALLYAHDHEDVAPGLVRLRSCCSPSSLLCSLASLKKNVLFEPAVRRFFRSPNRSP